MGVPTIPLIHELGNWAVNGFFVISGFLIAGSRARSRWWPYLWRRALRIFPAYWVALIVVAFLAAPLVAALVPGETLVLRSAVAYPIRNLGLVTIQHEVSNTLTSLPIPHVWLGTVGPSPCRPS